MLAAPKLHIPLCIEYNYLKGSSERRARVLILMGRYRLFTLIGLGYND